KALCLNEVGHDSDGLNAASSDAFRVGSRMAEMKMLGKTEKSDRTSNPNEKPQSCYCSALPKGSGLCLPYYTRWLAAVSRFGANKDYRVLFQGSYRSFFWAGCSPLVLLAASRYALSISSVSFFFCSSNLYSSALLGSSAPNEDPPNAANAATAND